MRHVDGPLLDNLFGSQIILELGHLHKKYCKTNKNDEVFKQLYCIRKISHILYDKFIKLLGGKQHNQMLQKSYNKKCGS